MPPNDHVVLCMLMRHLRCGNGQPCELRPPFVYDVKNMKCAGVNPGPPRSQYVRVTIPLSSNHTEYVTNRFLQ